MQDAGYTITHIAEETVPLSAGASSTFMISPIWTITAVVIVLAVITFILGYIYYRHNITLLDEEDNALKQMESVEGT